MSWNAMSIMPCHPSPQPTRALSLYLCTCLKAMDPRLCTAGLACSAWLRRHPNGSGDLGTKPDVTLAFQAAGGSWGDFCTWKTAAAESQ